MTGSLYGRITNYYITRGRLHAGPYHESFRSTVHGTEWQIKKTKQNKRQKPSQMPMTPLQSISQFFLESCFLEVKLAIRMTYLGVHLISAMPLSLSISTNSKSVLLPSTHWATCRNTSCFIFSEAREFYDLQEGENVRFAVLASSRSSGTTSPERRKWNPSSKTRAAGAPAVGHVGRRPFMIDAIRVPTMRLPFGSVWSSPKLKMTGCCLSLCKILQVGSWPLPHNTDKDKSWASGKI